MMIPSRACAPLINTIQAITMAAAIRMAEGVLPVRGMETIPDQAQVPDLDLLTVVQDLDLTVAAAMTIITAENRRSCFKPKTSPQMTLIKPLHTDQKSSIGHLNCKIRVIRAHPW